MITDRLKPPFHPVFIPPGQDQIQTVSILFVEVCPNISEHDMFNTYNMGVGMSVVVPAAEADKALRILAENGVDAYVIGEIVRGERKIEIV